MCAWVHCSRIARLRGGGRDAVHRDVVAGQLLAERFGQRDDAGLRRAVGRGVRVAFLAGNRRDVDDAAVVLPDHVRHDGAAAQKDAGQIDVEHLLPGVDRILPDLLLRPGDAGICDEDVDAAERLDRGARGGFDGGRTRMSTTASVRRVHPSKLASDRLDERAIAIPERHDGARGEQALGNGSADALPATGHDGAPAAQIDPIHRRSLREQRECLTLMSSADVNYAGCASATCGTKPESEFVSCFFKCLCRTPLEDLR